MFYRRNAPGDAVILDLRGSIGESLHVLAQKCPGDAVILDLRGSIGESLQGFPTELVVSTMSASDSNLRCRRQEKS